MSDSESSSSFVPGPAAESAADGGPRTVPHADGQVNPLAMTVAQAAKVLSAVGVGTVTEELIRRHIAAGAPATADGRINLVHYAAWLNQRMGPDGQDKDEHGA